MSNANPLLTSNTNHTFPHHPNPKTGQTSADFVALTPWTPTPSAAAIVILRLPQLLQKIGICRSKVYLLLDASSKYYDHDFPKPIRLGLRSVGWNLTEVEGWLQAQLNMRTGGAR